MTTRSGIEQNGVVDLRSPMDETQRSELVRQATHGDREALQRLILFYHDTLRRVVEDNLAPSMRAKVDPEDVLQQAYVDAFKSIPGCSFDGPGGFYKWLEKIALNGLRYEQRAFKQKKRDVSREIRDRPTVSTTYPDLLARLAADQSTPSRVVARAEATAAVMSSLARLTDDQRNVVRMRFLDERSVAEVAAAVGKTEPAIHMLCYRGLKELRKHMVSISRYLTR